MLKDVLKDTDRQVRQVLERQLPPEEPNITLLAEALYQMYGLGMEPRPTEDILKALQKRFSTALKLKQWTDLSPREWRQAPEVFWFQRPYLAENPDFLGAYGNHISQAKSVRPLRRLISVFLRDYPEQKPAMATISKLIRTQLEARREDSRLDGWRHRQETWQMFTLEIGPQEVARYCLLERLPVQDTLKQFGLPSSVWQGGFALAIYVRMIGFVRNKILPGLHDDIPKSLECFLNWSIDDGALRYRTKRPQLAEALLLPFVDSSIEQGKRNKIQHLRNYLLQYYQDPRIDPAAWQGVDDKARGVMLRWLIGTTLHVFFRILDEVALDEHWRYRRAFWNAYFQAHLIDEAWVLLGNSAKHRALNDMPKDATWGTLEEGDDANQCVLLLRIGDLIIGEWSHNGRCRIWKRQSRGAPSLYLSTYSGKALKSNFATVEQVAHLGSDNGRWQDKIAEYIQHHTGHQMSRSQYMNFRESAW